MRNALTILAGKLESKRPLERSKCKWEDKWAFIFVDIWFR
jgi:hypothetical protein